MASVTIKGVLVHDGLVLLGRNPRHEWELLGGQPDAADTSVADTLVREFREESGLVVAVGRLVLADLFEVIGEAGVPGRPLFPTAAPPSGWGVCSGSMDRTVGATTDNQAA